MLFIIELVCAAIVCITFPIYLYHSTGDNQKMEITFAAVCGISSVIGVALFMYALFTGNV